MSGELSYVQLEKLEDLLRLTVSSMRPPPLHHERVGDRHVYFIPTSLGFGKPVIYFVEMREKVPKRYVVYDTIHDKIEFSDELSTKPSLKHIPIMEVKAQNILHLP